MKKYFDSYDDARAFLESQLERTEHELLKTLTCLKRFCYVGWLIGALLFSIACFLTYNYSYLSPSFAPSVLWAIYEIREWKWYKAELAKFQKRVTDYLESNEHP